MRVSIKYKREKEILDSTIEVNSFNILYSETHEYIGVEIKGSDGEYRCNDVPENIAVEVSEKLNKKGHADLREYGEFLLTGFGNFTLPFSIDLSPTPAIEEASISKEEEAINKLVEDYIVSKLAAIISLSITVAVILITFFAIRPQGGWMILFFFVVVSSIYRTMLFAKKCSDNKKALTNAIDFYSDKGIQL